MEEPMGEPSPNDKEMCTLAQELLNLAEMRAEELDLHWGEVLISFGMAAKIMTRAYSPTLINSNATQQNTLCKMLLDKGFAATVIITDFGGNEAYRQKWIDAARKPRSGI